MSTYGELTETQQFAARVIADHARSTAFAIADGILPGNEGRNYVLRKIMRRAIYHGREHLGLNDAFFFKVCDQVVDQMHGAFPELETQRDFIGKMVRLEEERFGNTVTVGLTKLSDLFSDISFADKSALMMSTEHVRNTMPAALEFFTSGKADEVLGQLLDSARVGSAEEFPIEALSENVKSIPDTDEFLKTIDAGAKEKSEVFYRDLAKLYDTFGTPKDLIRVKLEEFLNVPVSEEEFNARFDAALTSLQQQSGIGKTERKGEVSPIYSAVMEKVGANIFHGYESTLISDAKVVAIFDGDKEIAELSEGLQGNVVLDQTPFYAESGGQVGDSGVLVSTTRGSGWGSHDSQQMSPPATAGGTDMRAVVSDTYSPVAGLIIHKVTVERGLLKVGDSLTASVDVAKRDATRRNHTATHLVHAALKEVLGTHVKQAGSVVAPNYLRFDFTHYQPMTAAEIGEVEDLVNRYILQNEPVTTNVMKIEDAMRSGAVAMFGEKYGGEVRVLSVGGGEFSKELCGGTHVRATGDIGSFKITGDEAIASGVRRIRAITGFDAFHRFREDEKLIDASLGALNTQRDNLPNAIARLQDELKKTRKEMDELKLKIALGGGQGSAAGGQEDEVREINGVKVLGKIADGLDANGTRQLSDTLLARLKSGVVIIGRSEEGKVGIIVRVSNDLTSKVKAGDIIREIAPIVGGRGGGKPDMAEGGGTEPAKLAEAIEAAYTAIERRLG